MRAGGGMKLGVLVGAFGISAWAGIGCVHAEFQDALVFITTSLEYSDGTTRKLGAGSGFVISRQGHVVTADHLIRNEVPAGAKLNITGSLRSPDNPAVKLVQVELVALGVDITLLRFDPNARQAWEYLKISRKKIGDTKLGDQVVAWGFALDQGLTRGQTQVQA